MIHLLAGHKGAGGKAVMDGPAKWALSRDPPDREFNWRRHVVLALWIVMILVIVFCVGLIYGEYHGFLSPASDQTPPPPWPVGLQ